jgi:acetyl-CoA synthetase
MKPLCEEVLEVLAVKLDSYAEAENQVAKWLQEYGAQGCSPGELLCDRYASDPARIALYYEDEQGRTSQFTFAELQQQSAHFAGLLRGLGIGKGDRVATLLTKSPEMVIAALGIWRLGAVLVPMFTAFGPQAVTYRLQNSRARALITDTTNRGKVEDAIDSVKLSVITVEDPTKARTESDDTSFWSGLVASEAVERPTRASGDDLMILLYTSGTTGEPKGVMVPVRALASFEAYMRFSLDVRDDDVFWNKSDPGWAYGLYWGLIGPLMLGKAMLYYNGPFDVESTYRLMEKYGVTNFTAAPTVYRAMRAAGDAPGLRDRLKLRVASSAGEILSPEIIAWSEQNLGVPVFDHYGQTELGMVIGNHHLPALNRPLRPGAAGQQMPGFRAVILDDEHNEVDAEQDGQLAIDIPNSPLYWFRGYHADPDRSAERFAGNGRYYLTSDIVKRDGDGYFYFSGRADDVIKSSGYRIGPFEIEGSLLQHPSVAEAVVVGKQDALRGQLVKAFVVLKPGQSPSNDLAEELSRFVKVRLSAHCYPREVEFLAELPKTPSGKVQRYLLRNK